MWGVALSDAEVLPFLDGELELAAINGPQAVVVSGSLSAAPRFEERLSRARVAFRRMPATHAFHSNMIAPVSDDLVELFGAMWASPWHCR
jgi:acyl transferase domain-containing protein